LPLAIFCLASLVALTYLGANALFWLLVKLKQLGDDVVQERATVGVLTRGFGWHLLNELD